MHGVRIVMAKLLNDFLYFLMLVLENGVADNLLKPRQIPQQLAWTPRFFRCDKESVLQSTLLPPIVELVVQQPLD